jgi:RuvB-like protein 1
LATNRGQALVRGTTDIVSPHGIPVDLLDRYVRRLIIVCVYGRRLLIHRILILRCLIVKTDGYTREQVGRVVQVRANVEGLKLGEGVLDRMAAEGERGSLR